MCEARNDASIAAFDTRATPPLPPAAANAPATVVAHATSCAFSFNHFCTAATQPDASRCAHEHDDTNDRNDWSNEYGTPASWSLAPCVDDAKVRSLSGCADETPPEPPVPSMHLRAAGSGAGADTLGLPPTFTGGGVSFPPPKNSLTAWPAFSRALRFASSWAFASAHARAAARRAFSAWAAASRFATSTGTCSSAWAIVSPFASGWRRCRRKSSSSSPRTAPAPHCANRASHRGPSASGSPRR